MSEVVAVVPVNQTQIADLAVVDAWLDKGPAGLMIGGAVLGGVVGGAASLCKLKIAPKGGMKGAAYGAALAAGAGLVFFGVMKWASKTQHEHLAHLAPVAPASPESPVVTKGEFAGFSRPLYRAAPPRRQQPPAGHQVGKQVPLPGRGYVPSYLGRVSHPAGWAPDRPGGFAR
jgi:hypothetical protein